MRFTNVISDTVLIASIQAVATVVTTCVVTLSGRKTRRHVKDVKQDVKDIKEALYLGTDEPQSFPSSDRVVNQQPIKEP